MIGTGTSARRLLAIAGGLLVLSSGNDLRLSARTQEPHVFKPALAPPDVMQPFLKDLLPGSDTFVEEKTATELEARLGELSGKLRAQASQASHVASWLLAPGFRGARLNDRQDGSATASGGNFEIEHAKASLDLALDAQAFAGELQTLVDGMQHVAVAEFLVTAIHTDAVTGIVRTDVRFDMVGSGASSWRLEHVGLWQLAWRQTTAGWQVVEWTAPSRVTSRARTPVFTEVTGLALAGNAALNRQFGNSLDTWMATLDSVLTRDSNGHHGVSVGDADGDGLEDLYVAQPAGLPNRLLRARGDGTFEDATERSGLGVLDDTAQSLFVDVDNDGDEDLVLATGTRPMLFLNDGTGRFSLAADAFQFKRPLQGVLTSISMADYDRDGYVDLYLCVYSYFFGAGEDKAGTPMPYYDARNGPPGVLFHNDQHGHFVDVTTESGLDTGNDRYHFAAAWGDYDGDGWPDLLVANDFGTKNLYRNLGRGDGAVKFADVAAEAGILDHGAGMSAAFVDYDNDGLLDIYTGNMWSASGLRVTGAAAFMPDAPPEVRELYRRHARGNSLFRNRGDGHFEDKTLDAHVEMGRWAWSSDAFDFDSDGWEDLYVVNGMLSREGSERDLDGFFWRQVVARSPLTRVKGTPYDDAWRTINQLLMHDSIASHQRNVFLRNDGHGGFDDVSGAVGLDLDQDGRSFAVLDVDHDGDPDLVVMAARQAPQLRVFRNDYAPRGAALAVRLVGKESNRDAIGARVIVETERLRRTKVVQAGSGFLSQHSKELLFGLGDSQRVVKLTVAWPSGRTQAFPDVAVNGTDSPRRRRSDRAGGVHFAGNGNGGLTIGPCQRDAIVCDMALRTVPGAGFLGGGHPWRHANTDGAERPSIAPPALDARRGALSCRAGRTCRRLRQAWPGTRRRTGSRPRSIGRRFDRRGAFCCTAGRDRAAERRCELRDPQPAVVHEPAGPAPADVASARRGWRCRQGLSRQPRRRSRARGRQGDRSD